MAITTTMATITGMLTITEPALLELVWLASPALPVGGFSYSEALESAVDAGLVSDEARARAWLLDQLALGPARCDLGVLAEAIDAWTAPSPPAALNAWWLATRETRELREQSAQMGRSLVEWLANRHAGDPRVAALRAFAPAPAWPVAFGLAAALAAVPVRAALHAFAFGWAENMVGAAIKAVPLGQSAGQRILGALAAAIPAAVDEALAMPRAERQAFAPMLAILSAQHEAQYSRLFRS
jgi:urease accessory protein